MSTANADFHARLGITGPIACRLALRDGTWIPGQQQRLQQLAPGT